MKSFKKFIVESLKTYNYTIKIAGEVDKNFLELFKYNLQKFDPIRVSEPTRTPIQKSPFGFAGIENQSITIIKADFRYPATEPMIKQIAKLLGYDENMVRVISSDFDSSVDTEAENCAKQLEDSPILTHEQMAEQPGAKEASKNYSDSYLSSIKKQTTDSMSDIKYAGKKTPTVFDPFKPYSDEKMNVTSPMTKINRPPKPSTGALK